MKLPGLKEQSLSRRKILLRVNFDVPLTADGQVADQTRIERALQTINFLLSLQNKLIIISHLDRPGGRPVPGLSLKPAVESLKRFLPSKKIKFSGEVLGEKTKKMILNLKPAEILFLENLRFNPGEETNDSEFAQGLASLADFFVNEAFACTHRQHASIIGIPQFLPAALGLDFLKEVKVLAKVRAKPKRPVVLVLGGVKKSKIKAAEKLTSWADYILVGGRMVEFDGIPQMINHHQKVKGSLTKNGEDINPETIRKFKAIIARAKTIVWSGPMGAFEDKRFERGTGEIAKSIVDSGAYTVAGGGDTEAALTRFGLVDKIDFISSGGGAMLGFLAEGTLPGIEAIRR